jgi:hypothetical protein
MCFVNMIFPQYTFPRLTPTSSESNMRSHITTLMMETESVSEMSAYLNHLTWLSVRENCLEFCCHKSYKTYVMFPILAIVSEASNQPFTWA